MDEELPNPTPEPATKDNQMLKAIWHSDPVESYHALAEEFTQRAEKRWSELEQIDSEEQPELWSQKKGELDAYRSAATLANMCMLARQDNAEQLDSGEFFDNSTE